MIMMMMMVIVIELKIAADNSATEGKGSSPRATLYLCEKEYIRRDTLIETSPISFNSN